MKLIRPLILTKGVNEVLKKAIHKLRERRGVSTYMAALIGLVFLAMLLVFAIETYAIMMVKKNCEEVATEIARYIEIKGAYDNSAKTEYARLCDVLNLDAQLTVTRSGKIQLENEFTVIVATKVKLLTFEIPLQGRATGRSEVYHK